MDKQTRKNYHVQGIIINKRNFFEADKIINILTKEKGIIGCVVKGARKSTSKLSGVTELFIYGDFFLAKGKKLDILTGSAPREYFKETTSSLDGLSHFFLISEVINKLLPYEVPNKKIFKETLDFFKMADTKTDAPLVYECIYKNLILLGYGLSLENCPKCHNEIELSKENILDLSAGGVLCENCQNEDTPTLKVSQQTLKLLWYIAENNIDKYSKVTFDKKTGEELIKTITIYLNYVYQREMETPKFIKAVKELQKSSKGSKI